MLMNTRASGRKMSLALTTLALWMAGSACIITIPKGNTAATSTLTTARPETAGRLERIIGSQATEIAALHATVRGLERQVEAQATMLHYLATRGPALPPAVDPVIPPTPNFPLRGSVEIEDGVCCIGGIAGETTSIDVTFFADSPFGEISGMRVHAGGGPFAQAQFEQVAWQPYAQYASFEVPIFINWVGFYVQVQFRDALGNLSPIYVDDISVEGMPAPETPLP